MAFAMQTYAWLTKLVDPKLDWRLLQAFLDLVECGSFRSAAAQHISSLNTVRARVSQLERFAGRQLVERRHHGITPTKDGEVVLAVIQAMLEARDATVEALAN